MVMHAYSLQSLCTQLYAYTKKLVKQHTSELKVVVISCYYLIFAVFVVTTFTITNVQQQEKFISDALIYFTCEANGIRNQCDRSFTELSGEIFTILSLILVGLFPIANLAYVLNIQELKQQILKYHPKYKQQQSLRSSTGTVKSQRSYLSSEWHFSLHYWTSQYRGRQCC